MSASFVPDAAGVIRASNTVTADSVSLGTQGIGAANGAITARAVP